MKALGFNLQQEYLLKTLTEEIAQSSEIEGEILNKNEVRSSIAKRLNIDNFTPIASSHYIDGIVEMMIDATHNYKQNLSLERLCGWHAALFPTGYSGMYKIKVGCLRDDQDGPMQVVSSALGHETVYYEAPAASLLPQYIKQFLSWINNHNSCGNQILKSAIAHLWFITLHPFEDGNGRIARAIADMMLSRAENTQYRFYSMSSQIQKERKEYYTVLESTQKGDLDITYWLEWFLHCLLKAIQNADKLADKIVSKALCWQKFSQVALDANQQKIINMLLDGFSGNLTSGKWAKICKCSQDTAGRSINYLIKNNILEQVGSGRSTHYILKCGEKMP